MTNSIEFLNSVNQMFDKSAKLLSLPEDLATKIKLANSTYTVNFGVTLKNKIHTLQALDACILNTMNQSKEVSDTHWVHHKVKLKP